MERMAAQENFEPAAVCELDPERIEIARADWPGIEGYTDVDEMLAKSGIGLVAVVLPHNLHGPVGLKCLNAGVNVVMEKPLAITVDECDAMIDAAEKNKVSVIPYHNRHWDPFPLTVKKHLHKIGKPYRWESYMGARFKPKDWWRSKKEISGGINYDWGAHHIEYMFQFLTSEISEISGYAVHGYWDNATNEDEAGIIIRFKGGEIGFHRTTHLDLTDRNFARLIGTEGAFVADGPGGGVKLYHTSENGEKTVTQLHMEPDGQDKFYENVHDHLIKGAPLVMDAYLGRRVIQVLDYGAKSAESGQSMKPKYP